MASEIPRPLPKAKRVSSACLNCRYAKVACSGVRPCARCVARCCEDSCLDIPRRPRTTKRRRDDSLVFGADHPTTTTAATTTSTTEPAYPGAFHAHPLHHLHHVAATHAQSPNHHLTTAAPLPPLASTNSATAKPTAAPTLASSSSIEAYAAHALARQRPFEQPTLSWHDGARFSDCRDIVSVYDLDPLGNLSGLKSCSATFRAIHNITDPMHSFRRATLVRPDLMQRDRAFLDVALTKTVRLFRCVHPLIINGREVFLDTQVSIFPTDSGVLRMVGQSNFSAPTNNPYEVLELELLWDRLPPDANELGLAHALATRDIQVIYLTLLRLVQLMDEQRSPKRRCISHVEEASSSSSSPTQPMPRRPEQLVESPSLANASSFGQASSSSSPSSPPEQELEQQQQQQQQQQLPPPKQPLPSLASLSAILSSESPMHRATADRRSLILPDPFATALPPRSRPSDMMMTTSLPPMHGHSDSPASYSFLPPPASPYGQPSSGARLPSHSMTHDTTTLRELNPR